MNDDLVQSDEAPADSESDDLPSSQDIGTLGLPQTAHIASDCQHRQSPTSPATKLSPEAEAERSRAQRAAAAQAALARFSAAASQGVMPTPEEIEQKTHLAEARDKLVKLIVSSIMNYRTNSIPAAAACLRVLSTLVHNVLSSPQDPKMRQVKVASKVFSTKVAAVDGAEAFLREAGWRKRTTEFVGTYNFDHQPGTMQWRILELAGAELDKACKMAEDKAARAAADSVAASRRKAGDDREREKIKLHVKGDREERKDRFVYQ